MEMRILGPLALFGVMAVRSLGLTAQPWRPAESPPVRTPYEQLIVSTHLSFGGVGYGGFTSRGEVAFHSIMLTTNALQTFFRVLTNGTPAAQLYALCAIQERTPQTFEESARSLVMCNPKVEQMRGCFFWEERASNVINRMR